MEKQTIDPNKTIMIGFHASPNEVAMIDAVNRYYQYKSRSALVRAAVLDAYDKLPFKEKCSD